MNYKGKEEEINLKNYKMGDNYAAAFREGLQLAHVKKLVVADNRLNEKGSLQLVQGLNKHIQELDLSNNKVGQPTIHHICLTLKVASESLDLRVVKLDNAGIDDS